MNPILVILCILCWTIGIFFDARAIILKTRPSEEVYWIKGMTYLAAFGLTIWLAGTM